MICGNAWVACCRCGISKIIGRIQSTTISETHFGTVPNKTRLLACHPTWAQARPTFAGGGAGDGLSGRRLRADAGCVVETVPTVSSTASTRVSAMAVCVSHNAAPFTKVV